MPRTKNEFDWSDAAVENLRGLTASGLTAKLIGERLGISTEAVAAKCRRAGIPLLGWSLRGVKWGGGGAVTLPPDATGPAPAASTRPARAGQVCAWVERDRMKGRWIECDALPMRREVYCKKHCRVAFPETGKEAA